MGHIDFTGVIRELDEIGFEGYLSLDCLPARPDPTTYLTHSINYMKQLEEAVALEKRLSGDELSCSIDISLRPDKSGFKTGAKGRVLQYFVKI